MAAPGGAIVANFAQFELELGLTSHFGAFFSPKTTVACLPHPTGAAPGPDCLVMSARMSAEMSPVGGVIFDPGGG